MQDSNKYINRRVVVQKESVNDDQDKIMVWSELWKILKQGCTTSFGRKEMLIKTKFKNNDE